MQYGRIEGLPKSVSKLIMGCDNQRTYPHGAAIWDDWYERGGNAFDTSWVYGRGVMERLLGQWVNARGVREEVVVTVKGAHTPRCLPDLLVEDFHESLERLEFDYADIYVMHRDNLDVPVGEFVDVLNELKDKGLIRGVFGGSNWTIDRFEEANEYALANDKQGLSVLNDNLSLARMVKPVWPGCVHVSDPESRRRLEKLNITNFSWSSQARGYFLPEGERMKLGARNFECWDAPDNRDRRRRAEKLAREKGCSAINIAAAFVLNQPFPSFALIGPRTIHETVTTLPALDLELTAAEIRWLWSGEEG
jgi:aryl-alcohol dehydrogenase-like predicted oxidoreductase